MEVKLDKRFAVEASAAQAWAVLADMRATAACMPGAQINEQIDDAHYRGSVKSKIGPAVMNFGGEIEVRQRDAAARSVQMLAKGSDKAGSSASMDLAASVQPGETAASCVLVGVATIVVGGKLAQFGNRLLVPVSDALLTQFADNFGAAARRVAKASAASANAAQDEPAYTEGGTTTLMVQAGQMPGEPIAPSAPAPVKELNVLALIWIVFRRWLVGLWGGRR